MTRLVSPPERLSESDSNRKIFRYTKAGDKHVLTFKVAVPTPSKLLVLALSCCPHLHPPYPDGGVYLSRSANLPGARITVWTMSRGVEGWINVYCTVLCRLILSTP